MSFLAGLFLIAHGLVHIAVWVPDPPADAPFDSRRSWLLGEAPALSQAIAVVACALFALAGAFVIFGAGLGAGLAVAGAIVSLLLVALTFNPWFLIAAAINAAIIAIAL